MGGGGEGGGEGGDGGEGGGGATTMATATDGTTMGAATAVALTPRAPDSALEDAVRLVAAF